MKFVDLKSPEPVDVSSFVHYMEPEFLQDNDDGTDLPLPDLAELAPAPQERRSGRNRGGRPLRDLPHDDKQQENTESSDASEESFGEGLVDEEAAATTNADASLPESETQTTETEKPKRRRRRRRRGRDDGAGTEATRPHDGNAGDESDDGPVQSEGTAASVSTDSASNSDESAAAPDGKRRRRRRRNRRKGSGRTPTGDTNSTGTPGTPGDSSSTSDRSES